MLPHDEFLRYIVTLTQPELARSEDRAAAVVVVVVRIYVVLLVGLDEDNLD